MRFSFSRNKQPPPGPASEPETPGPLYCQVYTLSETGPVRTHNEDNLAFAYLRKDQQYLIAVLADGMGGHNAGEVASGLACREVCSYMAARAGGGDPGTVLGQAVQEAHRQILETGRADKSQEGMGTTLTAVILKDSKLHFAHVGDSRLYQYRSGTLLQLTKDHTLVQQMYEQGEIKAGERSSHPMSNVLLQALGTTAAITPQNGGGFEVSPADRYLICSDGVYNLCPESELQSLLSMDDPSFALECLKALGTVRRATDNYSAIILSFSVATPERQSPETREQIAML